MTREDLRKLPTVEIDENRLDYHEIAEVIYRDDSKYNPLEKRTI